MSAPGSCVWAALFDWTVSPPGRILNRTNGTSYAVAHLAGVAALWLAHHGHAALSNRYGNHRVQAAFLHLLRTPGVCARPPGWDDDWGVGRVDAEALLSQPLPDPATIDRVAEFGAPAQPSAVDRIAALTNVTPTRVHDWLGHTLGPPTLRPEPTDSQASWPTCCWGWRTHRCEPASQCPGSGRSPPTRRRPRRPPICAP